MRQSATPAIKNYRTSLMRRCSVIETTNVSVCSISLAYQPDDNQGFKAVGAITQELTSLIFRSQDRQSIVRIFKIFRSSFNWLDTVHMLPSDINVIAFDVLETSTVPIFQLFLKTIMTNNNLNGLELDYVSHLNKAEEHYRTLILSKMWDAAG